jgi:hypothetical protein
LYISFSLLVAIGIEAFNKFSEEQKAESEEKEGESGAGRGSSASDEDQSLCSIMSGKRLLKKIAVWTSEAISSTRVIKQSSPGSFPVFIVESWGQSYKQLM